MARRTTPSRRSRYCRWRVRVGFLLLPVVYLSAQPTANSLLFALCIALPGLALRIWAAGHLEKARCLATGGPYAHTRHPLYLANLLLALALAVAAASPWSVVLIATYWAVFYPGVIRAENRFLSEKFPLDYEGWAGSVPSFFPRLLPAGPGGGPFRWRRVITNGEWRAWLGWLSVYALLVAMGWLSRISSESVIAG